MTVRCAVPGTLPGRDFRRAAELVASELAAPHLAALCELPDRGHHGRLLGRAAAQLQELYTELTSYGWRLVARPGADDQRARALLRSDVDTLAEVRGERTEAGQAITDAVGLEILGPVSLAAQLHLPGGEKVLIDHGARRDLAQSLAAGAADHVAHVRRSVAPQRLRVTLLEPDYHRVRTGSVPTVSGYQSIRSLPRDETRGMLGVVIEALRQAGADELMLDFGSGAENEHTEDFRSQRGAEVDGFALPVHRATSADWERAAVLVEDGAQIVASLLHPEEPGALPEVSQLAARLVQPWQALGMPASSLSSFTVSAFGAAHRHLSAQLGEAAAMRTLTRLRDTAEALADRAAA